jgi:DNA-binding transcriptional LysR family regulator
MERELKHFIAAVDRGSITLAADSLGLTQSALTKSLQRLEARLGIKLLERGIRGVKLTQAGEAMLVRAKSVDAEFRYLALEAAEFRAQAVRHLRIGASPSWASSILPGVVSAICRQFPGTRIDTKIDLEAGILSALREGSIDFAICGRVQGSSEQGIDYKPLQPIDTLVACRKDHPLVGTWSGDPAALLACDWLDYRAALDRPRGTGTPLSHSVTGTISNTQAWSLVPGILSQTDFLASMPEQLESYLAQFGIIYLTKDLKVSSINTGVWCRTSVAETRLGRWVFKRILEATRQSLPPPKTRAQI